MSEVFRGHESVGFDDFFDITAVNTDCDSHNHVLWSLGDFAVDSQEVGSLLLGLRERDIPPWF